MTKVFLCYREQHNNSNIGGVVSIMRSYLSHAELFEHSGFALDSFCYQPEEKWEHVNSKAANVAYIFQQRQALKKLLRKENDCILNIHTSREFLFLKDVLLAGLAKGYGVPVVLTIHVGNIFTVFNRIYQLQNSLIRLMNKYIDKSVFLTEEIRKQFVEKGLAYEKTEVLYNFHDLKEIKAGKARTNQLHLMYMGAIHREKGILELLSALEKLDDLDYHIDICGKLTDQSIKETFENKIHVLGNRAELHGYVTGDLKTQLLERADIFILPSYHEGMPLVILEALASGCAIISTPVGGTPEILNDENVKWAAVQSAEDIEKAIKALAADPELLSKMQLANRTLGGSFSIEKNISSLCAIYQKCH